MTTLTPLEREKARLFEKMSKDLQNVASEFEKLDNRLNSNAIRIAHSKGQTVSRVIDQAARFGSSAVEELAHYLCQSPQHLYRLRNFSETFSICEIEELLDSRIYPGQRLTLSHFLLLTNIQSFNERSKLTSLAIKKHWSVKDLELEVASRTTNPPRNGGRKPARPKSVPAGVQQIQKTIQSTNNRVDIWLEEVFDKVDNLSPAEFTETMNSDLVDIKTKLLDLNDNTTVLLTRIETALERYDVIQSNK